MTDYKPLILEAFDTLQIADTIGKRPFQAKAYQGVIKQLKELKTPVNTLNDLANIKGAGEKIKEKFKEIIETGSLRAAERAKAEFPIELYVNLQKVYGVGPVKAKDLVEKDKVASIVDLRAKVAANPKLLNEIQKAGLRYYEDINERIPRAEMQQHETFLMEFLPQSLRGIIVGSFRRKAATSGDIDMLLKGSTGFKDFIKMLKDNKYIVEILAEGDKKCLAIVKLPGGGTRGRRLDLLVTPEAEYPYAILYFTGSDLFNVAMRKYALTKGYSLNEHTLTPVGEQTVQPPSMKTEKDIFDFLGLKYVEPENRLGESQIVEGPRIIKIRRLKTRA